MTHSSSLANRGYSDQPRVQIFVKGYGFLSFAKNWRNLSGKYSENLLDHAKQSATDAIKTSSEGVIQKTAETTGDLIGIIQKQLQMHAIKKYLKKDIYLQKKNRKLMMI